MVTQRPNSQMAHQQQQHQQQQPLESIVTQTQVSTRRRRIGVQRKQQCQRQRVKVFASTLSSYAAAITVAILCATHTRASHLSKQAVHPQQSQQGQQHQQQHDNQPSGFPHSFASETSFQLIPPAHAVSIERNHRRYIRPVAPIAPLTAIDEFIDSSGEDVEHTNWHQQQHQHPYEHQQQQHQQQHTASGTQQKRRQRRRSSSTAHQDQQAQVSSSPQLTQAGELDVATHGVGSSTMQRSGYPSDPNAHSYALPSAEDRQQSNANAIRRIRERLQRDRAARHPRRLDSQATHLGSTETSTERDGSDNQGIFSDFDGDSSSDVSWDDQYDPEVDPDYDCESFSFMPHCQTAGPTGLGPPIGNDATAPTLSPSGSDGQVQGPDNTSSPTDAPTPEVSDIGGADASGDGGDSDAPSVPVDPSQPPPPLPPNTVLQRLSVALSYSKDDLMFDQKRYFHRLVKHTTTYILHEFSPFEVRLKGRLVAGIEGLEQEDQPDNQSSSSSSSSHDSGHGAADGAPPRPPPTSNPPPRSAPGPGPPPPGQGGNHGPPPPHPPPRRSLHKVSHKGNKEWNANVDPDSRPVVVLDFSEPLIKTRRLKENDPDIQLRTTDKVSRLKHHKSRIWPIFATNATRWWKNETTEDPQDGFTNTTTYHWYGVDVMYTVFWMDGKSLKHEKYLRDVTHVCQVVLDVTLEEGIYQEEWGLLHAYFQEKGEDGFKPASKCNITESDDVGAQQNTTTDQGGGNQTFGEDGQPVDRPRRREDHVKVLAMCSAGGEMNTTDALAKPPEETSDDSSSSSSDSSHSPSEDTRSTGKMYTSHLEPGGAWSLREWLGMAMLTSTLVIALTISGLASYLQKRQRYKQTWQPYLTEDGILQVLDVGWRYQHGNAEPQKAGDDGANDHGLPNHDRADRETNNDQFYLQVYDKRNIGYSEDNSVLKGGPHLIHTAAAEDAHGLAPTELPSSSASSATRSRQQNANSSTHDHPGHGFDVNDK